MSLISKIKVDTNEIELIVLGDPHYGAPGQDRKLIQRAVQYVLKPDGKQKYIVSVGDDLDLSTGKDFGVIGYHFSTDESIDMLAEDLRPAAKEGKFIGGVTGNHDDRITKHLKTEHCPLKSLYKEWSRSFGYEIKRGASLIFDFSVKRTNDAKYANFTGVLSHGSGGGGTVGAVVNRIQTFKNLVQNADFYVQGHFHQPAYFNYDASIYDVSRHEVRTITQHFICAGSCLGYEGYAEKMALRKNTPSVAIIKMYAGNNNIKKEINVSFETTNSLNKLV